VKPHSKRKKKESKAEYNARMRKVNRRWRKKEAVRRQRYKELMKQVEETFWEKLARSKSKKTDFVIVIGKKKK